MEFRNGQLDVKEGPTLQIRADDVTEDGEISGYASVFNKADSFNDIIKKGAFKGNSAQKTKLLFQHDRSEVLGMWDEMKEDSKGLFVKGTLFIEEIQKAREVHALMKRGAIDGLSIGFFATDWKIEKDARIITKIDLREISVVTFPAQDSARVTDVKGILNCRDGELPSEREFENWLRREAGMSRSQAKAVISQGYNALLRDADNGEDSEQQFESVLESINNLKATLTTR